MSGLPDPRATALELASAHPEAALPCPECAASVKASNLAKHLGKVHPGPSPAPRWLGSDHAIQIPLLVAAVVAGVATAATIALAPRYEQIAMWAFIVVLSGALGLAGASLLGKLPASLTLEGDGLVLRYGLGLLRRRVRLPPTSLEVGGRVEHRTSAMSSARLPNAPGYDVSVGRYLRVVGAGGQLTLGSATNTGFTKHWAPDGWSAGGRRRRWDIVLPPSAIVAVEYLLVRHGVLKVR